MKVCRQPNDSVTLPSGKDPSISKRRFYDNFLDAFFKSSSIFVWWRHVKLNAFQDRRPGDQQSKRGFHIHETGLKSAQNLCSALSTVLLILLPSACTILIKITLNKLLLSSCLFASCLHVVQNKMLHSEAWHNLLDLREILNLNSCYIHLVAATID